MKKTISMIAALGLCLALASPAAADFGAEPDADHGPNPMAVVPIVIGATVFAVSVPFVALLAPIHVMQSYDALVMAPVRALVGAPARR